MDTIICIAAYYIIENVTYAQIYCRKNRSRVATPPIICRNPKCNLCKNCGFAYMTLTTSWMCWTLKVQIKLKYNLNSQVLRVDLMVSYSRSYWLDLNFLRWCPHIIKYPQTTVNKHKIKVLLFAVLFYYFMPTRKFLSPPVFGTAIVNGYAWVSKSQNISSGRIKNSIQNYIWKLHLMRYFITHFEFMGLIMFAYFEIIVIFVC